MVFGDIVRFIDFIAFIKKNKNKIFKNGDTILHYIAKRTPGISFLIINRFDEIKKLVPKYLFKKNNKGETVIDILKRKLDYETFLFNEYRLKKLFEEIKKGKFIEDTILKINFFTKAFNNVEKGISKKYPFSISQNFEFKERFLPKYNKKTDMEFVEEKNNLFFIDENYKLIFYNRYGGDMAKHYSLFKELENILKKAQKKDEVKKIKRIMERLNEIKNEILNSERIKTLKEIEKELKLIKEDINKKFQHSGTIEEIMEPKIRLWYNGLLLKIEKIEKELYEKKQIILIEKYYKKLDPKIDKDLIKNHIINESEEGSEIVVKFLLEKINLNKEFNDIELLKLIKKAKKNIVPIIINKMNEENDNKKIKPKKIENKKKNKWIL